MRRLGVRLVLAALALVTVGGAGVLAWQLREQRTTYYTDESTIRTPVEEAQPRDVLWQPAERLPAAISSGSDEYEPAASRDGLLLLFVRRAAAGDADLLMTRRTPEGWSDPEPLATLNTAADELGPALSADGGTLYFHSDRAGGQGGYDLWTATRDGDGWGEPVNLGPGVNSAWHEYGACVTSDGTAIYFTSNRPAPGAVDAPDAGDRSAIRADRRQRGYDIHVAAMTAGGFGIAGPVAALNSPQNDGAPAVSPAGDFVYFCSDRPGGLGGYDVYRARRLRGAHLLPTNLGPSLNSAADDLDPAVALGGFGIYFSSNRTAGAADDSGFDLYFAASREVFPVTETRRADLDWARLWSVLWPLLLAIVIVLLLVLALGRIWRRQASLGRLSLLARCILASLLVHMILLLVLMVLEVRSSIAELLPPSSGARVILVSAGAAGDVAAQIRGELTDVEVTAADAASSPRREPAVPTETPTVSAQLPAPVTESPPEREPLTAPETSDAPAEAALASNRPAEAPAPQRSAAVELPSEAPPRSAAEAALVMPSGAAPRPSAADAMPPPDAGGDDPMRFDIADAVAARPEPARSLVASPDAPDSVAPVANAAAPPRQPAVETAPDPMEVRAPSRTAARSTAETQVAIAARPLTPARPEAPPSTAPKATTFEVAPATAAAASSAASLVSGADASPAPVSPATARPASTEAITATPAPLELAAVPTSARRGGDEAANPVAPGAVPTGRSRAEPTPPSAPDPTIAMAPPSRPLPGDAASLSRASARPTDARAPSARDTPARTSPPRALAAAVDEITVPGPPSASATGTAEALLMTAAVSVRTTRRNVVPEATGVAEAPLTRMAPVPSAPLARPEWLAAVTVETFDPAPATDFGAPSVPARAEAVAVAVPRAATRAGGASEPSRADRRVGASATRIRRARMVVTGADGHDPSATITPDTAPVPRDARSLAARPSEAPTAPADSNVAPGSAPAPVAPPRDAVALAIDLPAAPSESIVPPNGMESGGATPVGSPRATARRAPATTIGPVRSRSVLVAPQHSAPAAAAVTMAALDVSDAQRSPTPAERVAAGLPQPARSAAAFDLALPRADERAPPSVTPPTPRMARASIGARATPALTGTMSISTAPRTDDLERSAPIAPDAAVRRRPFDVSDAAPPAPIAGLRIPAAERDAFGGITLDLAVPRSAAPPEDRYAQRSEDARPRLVEKYGGSRETEAAVALALAWMARHQSPDGRWDGRTFDDRCGGCGDAAKVKSDAALTGLVLLCFLATNHSHVADGPYRDIVERGINWLLQSQRRDGDLMARESMYSHGIATIALAEAYGMTGDDRLAGPVRAAVGFIERARNDDVGGWRYDPGQAGDTSVMGWQVMALASARRAGIDVGEVGFDVARQWLDKVTRSGRPGLYSYQPKRRITAAMTAEGLFVQQLLGADAGAAHMDVSVDYILANLPDWRNAGNTYYWYYATLALFQHGGEPWRAWNDRVKNELLAHQVRSGKAAGSWAPNGKWSTVGGRVYQTAIATLTLEVYYRYLPLYVSEGAADRGRRGTE